MLFDINDFDETLPGPWEWDVKRLAASLAIAGRDRGFSAKQRAAIVTSAANGYRTEMATLAAMRNLEVWYRRFAVSELMADFAASDPRQDRRLSEELIAKARTRDNLQAFAKMTHIVDGEPRISADVPLIVPIEELMVAPDAETLMGHLRGMLISFRRSLASDRRALLEQYRLVHVARKVVGVGSVGTRAWIALLLGRDGTDPLFLQVKEAQRSVLERFVGKSAYTNQGERVVSGQRLMQAASDIFLGWDRIEGIDGRRRDFYIRQLRDWKGSIDPDRILPAGMSNYARVCGWTLARAHARSGDRIAIASYLGSGVVFDRALADFAESYADQNQRDYESLRRAVAAGRVTATPGL
jgi:uncharacterized protein (DUF2252 family)